MIYLDHAATTPMKKEVLQSMLPFLTSDYANPSSSYSAARVCRQAIDHAKAQIARLIGADAQEIYITSGGSESDNWALRGIMQSSPSGKNHLITSAIEHPAVLETCASLERDGYRVTYIPVNADGVVDVEALRSEISSDTALISVMMANNEIGTIQPVTEISAIAHQYGIPVHTDAVQSIGHIPVNVEALGVDLLSLSAHKFYGPKGIGALYIRKGVRIDRLIYGGEQEKGLRAGTENTAAIVGMGKAAELASASMGLQRSKITKLRDFLIDEALRQLPSVCINGILAPRLPGHVHLTIDHCDSALLLMQLDMMGIAASSGSACAAGAVERSHVMKALGKTEDNQADLRFTLGEQNDAEDVRAAIDALASILSHEGES